jgi:hypothetical protein
MQGISHTRVGFCRGLWAPVRAIEVLRKSARRSLETRKLEERIDSVDVTSLRDGNWTHDPIDAWRTIDRLICGQDGRWTVDETWRGRETVILSFSGYT